MFASFFRQIKVSLASNVKAISVSLKNSHKWFGVRGEVLSARYLEKNHYHIIARNWTCRRGEIDIVAIKDRQLVFVEVKSRIMQEGYQWRASDYVDFRKMQKIKLLSELFVKTEQHKLRKYRIRGYSYDVIGVEVERGVTSINHIKDAFG